MRWLPVFILLQATLFSCAEEKKSNFDVHSPKYSLDEIESLEGVADKSEQLPERVVSLIDSCIRNECHWRFNKELGKEVIIRYSKTYFAPDSSKLFTIVTHQVNDVENRAFPEANIEIRGDAFIGYREGDQWTLYLYEAMMPADYFDYKKVEDGMIDFFEGENYRNKTPLYRYENERKWTDHVYASPNEAKFWSSNLWIQNLEIEDVYPFEIRRTNVGTEKLKSINELLKDCCEKY